MYGFILQSFVDYLVANFPKEQVEEIINMADHMDKRHNGSAAEKNAETMPRYRHFYFRGFSTYKAYGDDMLAGLMRATSAIAVMPLPTLLEQFATHVFKYIADDSGFRLVLDLCGRDFPDFLQNLDLMHEYLRHNFPKIRPPCFAVSEQTPDGMKVSYRTGRKGFHCFASTLLKLVAEKYYGLTITLTTDEQQVEKADKSFYETIINLEFDNVNHYVKQKKVRCCAENLKLACLRPERVFGQLMPFHISFIERKLEIVSIGKSLAVFLNNIIGAELLSVFTILFPKKAASWSWQEIGINGNNMFTLECKIPKRPSETSSEAATLPKLRLRGQMVYFKQFNCITFNGIPFLKEVDDLQKIDMKCAHLPKADASRFLLSVGLHQKQSTNRKVVTQLESEIDSGLERTFCLQADRRSMLQDTVPRPLVSLIELTGKAEETELIRGFVGAITVVFTMDQPSSHNSGGVLIKERLTHLNSLLEKIDRTCDKYNLAKLPSTSEEFTFVAGLPVESKSSVNNVVLAAVELLIFQARSNSSNKHVINKLHRDTTSASARQSTMPPPSQAGNIISKIDGIKPNLLMAVECGEASGSLVSLENVNYYHVVGETILRTQRFAPLCPPNTINVTANVTEWLANSEYANEYDFTKICLDGNEAANKSKLANRGPKAKPVELFQLTRFPGKEAFDAAQNEDEAVTKNNDNDSVYSGAANTVVNEASQLSSTSGISLDYANGHSVESRSLVDQVGLNEFIAKVEKRRLEREKSIDDEDREIESEQRGKNYFDSAEFLADTKQAAMMETVEFDDEVWADDGNNSRRSATPGAKRPPTKQGQQKIDMKNKTKSVDTGTKSVDTGTKNSDVGNEDDDGDQTDFSSSSRRPSVDNGELAKYSAKLSAITSDGGSNDGSCAVGVQRQETAPLKKSEATLLNNNKTTKSNDINNDNIENTNDNNHAPVVRNGPKCIPRDACIIS